MAAPAEWLQVEPDPTSVKLKTLIPFSGKPQTFYDWVFDIRVYLTMFEVQHHLMLPDDQAPPGADELLAHCTKNRKAVHAYLNSYLLGDAKKLVNRDEMIGRSGTVWHTL